MNKTITNVGLGLAVGLLICLFRMPYGYYTLIRFASMVVFVCMAVSFYKEQKTTLCIIAGSLALLFQPFFKIVLDRTTWNVVDVIVAFGFLKKTIGQGTQNEKALVNNPSAVGHRGFRDMAVQAVVCTVHSSHKQAVDQV